MPKTQYLRDNAEEFLNSLTHAVTLGVAIMCTYILTERASESGLDVWPYYLFGGSMCTTFLGSVLYHGALDPVLKAKFRTFDLVSIFIAIAGGFVSLFRIMLPDFEFFLYTTTSISVTLLCVFIKFKVFKNSNNFVPSCGVYLLAGWSNVFFLADEACFACPRAGSLVIAGGAVYTLGCIFYLWDYKRYFHTIWHLCASCGFILHVGALMAVT